jgi:uncharacterized membrane protein YeaQ/YmgE (transglycosylase-associated protein family)
MDGSSLLWFLILLAIFGLIVGALGRLLVPGPTPIGALGTMAAGIAGSFLGGFVGRLLLGPGLTQGWMWVLSILGAAVVVALVSRRADGYAGRGFGWGRRHDAYDAYDAPVVVHEVEGPYRPRRRRRFF